MLSLLILLAIGLCLAYCSEKEVLVFKISDKRRLNIPLILMVVIFAVYCGLRTDYNDTTSYMGGFRLAAPVITHFSRPIELFENPLFYLVESVFKHHISSNVHVFFIGVALFSYASILRLISKFSESFPLSIVLFFSIGLFLSHYAAIKQCLAIAVLTYAIDALIQKKYFLYFLFVFIAFLFHTYAIFFVIVPFFTFKPWTIPTYFTIGIVIIALFTFESTLDNFLSIADEVGKNISEEHAVKSAGINPFRLAVFSIPPLLSFFFQENLNDSYDRKKIIFTNLSILSFLVMSLGIFSGGNLFGRSAIYFEIGTIIILPSILKDIFDEQSHKFINIVASMCYLSFFIYSIKDFDSEFKSIGLGEFILDLIHSAL